MTGGFGRGVPPIALRPGGLRAGDGVDGPPATVEELVAADDGAAEAVAFGVAGDAVVTELVDVDAGVVRWRNRTTGMPPRAFGGDLVVVGDDQRTAGLDRATGLERWRVDGAFRARDGATVALAAADGVVLVDGRDGSAGVALAPPVPAPPGAVLAVCAAPTPHLYAFHDGRLARWDVDGSDLRVTWAVAGTPPSRLDACGATVLLIGGDPRAAVALDPATGAVVGGPVAARDLWPARTGDGVELATPAGIEVRDRRLGAPRQLEPVRVGRLLARRGGRRLVARGDGGLVLLDERGARALGEPTGPNRVALGDRYLLGGPWALPARTLASRVYRWELPTPRAEARPQPPLGETLLGVAPALDLPAPTPLPAGVARDGAGAWAVGAALVDPADPARIYVQVLEQRPSDTVGAGLAAFELGAGGAAGDWRWHAAAACPPGMAVALAATARVVLCGARLNSAGTGVVRAVDRRDGRTLWDWRGLTVDAVLAASRTDRPADAAADPADLIVVLEGSRVVVLDPATGAERVSWRASDGWLPRVALVRQPGDVVVASLEHGHVVLRSATLGLRPFASLLVGGVVSAFFAVDEQVAVTLTDGTAYLVDTRGRAVAAAGLAPSWEGAGDLLAVTTTDPDGRDGVVVAYDPAGVVQVSATLPGSGPILLAPRAAVAGAPLALVGGTRITALTADGQPALVTDLPPDAPRTPLVTTAVDDAAVVAAVLARPLRLVRLDVRPPPRPALPPPPPTPTPAPEPSSPPPI